MTATGFTEAGPCPAADLRERRHVPGAALRGCIARMRDDPAAEFRTETAATALGSSPFAFIRAFKAVTGLSPQRFHAAVRIEQAKRLLVETERSVTDISLDVGYSSLGTFVRTFTALVGVSPRHLRRLARGDEAAIEEIGALGAPTPSTGTMLHAELELPLPRGALVAAGLFPQGLPAGLPFDGCFVDPASPRFSLAWPVSRRRASLLVAAVGSFDLGDAWAGRMNEIQVCGVALLPTMRGTGRLRLRLRPLMETDPPLLTPVPLLMHLQSVRSAAGPGR